MHNNERLTPLERSLVGSFVAIDKRPIGQYYLLPQIAFDTEWLHDPLCMAVYKACELQNTDAAYHATPPTPEHLAHIILTNRLVSVPESAVSTLDAHSETLRTLIQQITSMAEVGVDGLPMVQCIALGLKEGVRDYMMSTELARKVSDALTGIGSANQKWERAASLLEQYQPERDEETVIAQDNSRKYTRKLKESGQNMVNNHRRLLTLPPEFGELADKFGYLENGNLFVLSGLNSTGKSALMMQMACGFARMVQPADKGQPKPIIAYFHLEDQSKRIIQRLTVQLTAATMRELQTGDPRNKFAAALKIMESWPGELQFIHCPGASANWIAQRILALKPAAVFVDYAQKLELRDMMKQYGTETSALSNSVEILKRAAENTAHPTIIWLGSQETDYQNVGKGQQQRTGTKGSRDIEVKGQGLLRIVRTRAEEPLIVDGIRLADKGEFSPYMELHIEKNSDGGGKGGREVGVFVAPRMIFESLVFRNWKRSNPGMSYPEPKSVTAPSPEYYVNHDTKLGAYDKVDQVWDQFAQTNKQQPLSTPPATETPKPNGKKPPKTEPKETAVHVDWNGDLEGGSDIPF